MCIKTTINLQLKKLIVWLTRWKKLIAWQLYYMFHLRGVYLVHSVKHLVTVYFVANRLSI